MGKGVFNNGKFTLYVAFCNFSKKDSNLKTGCFTAFNNASQLLYQATNGMMQFGTLNEVSCQSASDADIYIYKGIGTPAGLVCGIRKQHLWMTLYTDGIFGILGVDGARVILHEFGHYALCLYDEYRNSLGAQPAHCADPTTGHCIMEFYNKPAVAKFCTADTHDTNQDPVRTNWQQEANKQSCWVHLSKNYCLQYALPPGITCADMPLCQTHPEYVYPPNPRPAVALEPRQPEIRLEYAQPQIIVLPAESRFALLLDRSSSMTPAALNGVRFGAHFWLTYLSQTCARLAIIFYNQDQQAIWPLDSLSDLQLGPILEALTAITPTGRTNLAGALQEGLVQLTGPGYPATNMDLMLVTDGRHNTGELPPGWTGNLANTLALEGIRLQTLGLGAHDDQASLERITAGVGGRFYQLGENLQMSEAQLAIQEALVYLAGERRAGFGLTMTERGRLQAPTSAGLELLITVKHQGYYTPAALDFIRKDLFDPRRPDIVCRYQVYVEEGAQQATFVTNYLASNAINTYLFRPGGMPVCPGVDADVRFCQPADAPYASYVVQDPTPGDWTMLVVRRQEKDEIPFSVMACCHHPELTVAVDVNRQLYEVDQKIIIKALAYYRGAPLTGMDSPIALVGMNNVFSGGPEDEKIILQPQMISFDDQGNRLKEPVPAPEGIYLGAVSRSKPGSYKVRVHFTNRGNQGPIFQRLQSLQIHVGPLPSGGDIEEK